MGERLYELREELGLSQRAFAGKIGISPATVSAVELGKRELSTGQVKMVCGAFMVNEAWLLHGEGEMFQPAKDANEFLETLYQMDAGMRQLTLKIARLILQEQERREGK